MIRSAERCTSPKSGKSCGSLSFTTCLTLLLITLVILSTVPLSSQAEAYYSTSDHQLSSKMMEKYGEDILRLLSRPSSNTKKRSCIRRGAICDLRPNDCCFNSLCKCNLWGTNCRCQRMGLFQRWG